MSKKGPKSTKETSQAVSYEIRDIVLGKVRGFPPWPGMIVDPDSVPENVKSEAPAPRKTTFHCVQFFPTGDYAWLVAKDISKLLPHEIESYINEPYKKSGDLLAGYRIALDPKQWEAEREAISLNAVQEDANAEIDQLESENDGEPKKAKSKKRKRDSEPASAKPKKAPKAKKDSAEPTKKKSASTASKAKKNGTKSKAMVESEDEGDAEADDDDAGPSKKATPPPPKKAKREKDDENDDDPEASKVRDWRHKLQKIFLSNKGLPKEEDMPSVDTLFKTVENYDKITIEYLQSSKIGKVMRHIAALGEDKVPRDAEFKFRDRAKALVEKWHLVLNANKPTDSEGGVGANGTTKNQAGEKDDGVTKGTAAINLNGKTEDASPTSPDADADAVADTSVLPDVTMSEA